MKSTKNIRRSMVIMKADGSTNVVEIKVMN